MSRNPRLVFPAFDGSQHARLGHGNDCVIVMIENAMYRPAGSAIVLTPVEARALGRSLIRQAGAAERIHLEEEKRLVEEYAKFLASPASRRLELRP